MGINESWSYVHLSPKGESYASLLAGLQNIFVQWTVKIIDSSVQKLVYIALNSIIEDFSGMKFRMLNFLCQVD